MTVLIDPPRWPAHGTVWSHLVSDESLDELHAFAAALGLPRRAFDLDHYDVPASRHRDAVAAGAEPVSGPELVRRLRDAGLRVRPVDRPEAAAEQRLAFLDSSWRALGTSVPGVAVTDADGPGTWLALGRSLLDRWAEPHRRYHDTLHLHDVLLALDQLSSAEMRVGPLARTAAWFHDAVYDGQADDEARSAQLARDSLAALGVERIFVERVARIVEATRPGAPAPELDGEAAADAAALLDADLAILGAGPKRYAAYTRAVRAEYAHVADPEFRAGRARILASFLERESIYRTDAARALWEARARANLAAEIAALRGEG